MTGTPARQTVRDSRAEAYPRPELDTPSYQILEKLSGRRDGRYSGLLGGLVPQWLGRWIRDRKVASSTPGRSTTK